MKDTSGYPSKEAMVGAEKQVTVPFGNRTIDEEAMCSLVTEAHQECAAKIFDLVPKGDERDNAIAHMRQSLVFSIGSIPATGDAPANESDTSDDVSGLEDEVDELNAEVKSLQEKLSDAACDAEQANTQLEESQKQLDETRAELEKAKQDLAAAQSLIDEAAEAENAE